MLLFWSSYIDDILNICFDGSQSCSFEILMCQHVSNSSSVVYWVTNPHVYTTVDIGIWVLKSASIPSDLCLLVGSSHIGIPKYWHWLGFIKVFSILFPNHKPWKNTSSESIVYEVAPVHIGIFTCSQYSAWKGATVLSSYVNDIGPMFHPKQCAPVWLSISVEHIFQWICSCLLEVFSIKLLDPVLILNISDCIMQP